MNYTEFKAKQEKEISDFPMFFAFSDKQLNEGLKKLNAKPSELCSIPGGGFMLKLNKESFHKLIDKMTEDKKTFLDNETNLISAIEYELGNHEFCITYDPTDTLETLNITLDNEKNLRCFNKAKTSYMNSYINWCEANTI